MNGLIESLALGAAALWVALAAALVVAWTRQTSRETLKEAVPSALVVLAVQTLHFTEEFAGNYQDRFFALFGRDGWPDKVFVAFNLGWVAVWALAAAGALRGVWPYPCAAFLWFLAVAALLNSAASVALSVVTGNYFPGLITAPVLGIVGFLLLGRLRA